MAGPTPYEMLGGAEGVRRLAMRFYAIMAARPDAAGIRAMHDGDLAPVAEKLFGFLSGWTGGPRDYFERGDAPCIMSAHHRFPIGAEEREAWLACMRQAMDEEGVSPEARAILAPAFDRISTGMMSRQP